MRIFLAIATLAGLLPIASGAVHTLFTSNRNAPANIHSLEFNDETNTLKLIKSMKADATHIWLSFSVSFLTLDDFLKQCVTNMASTTRQMSMAHLCKKREQQATRSSMLQR
jgi:hypothetical protein